MALNEYGGNWITTYTGRQFHFLGPQPQEISIVDIAHALSVTCRFGGQCKVFYSVGEHSVRVAEITPPPWKLMGLLHDASEAYMPDIPRPMKAQLPEFIIIELGILKAIWNRFVGDRWRDAPKDIIKEADNILLATEARDLMANMSDWAPLPKPLREIIKPITSGEAEELFLHTFIRIFEELHLE